MRLLFSTDAPWVASGYGTQSKLMLPRIAALGHEVAVACRSGLDGASLTWCGYRLYPRGRTTASQDVLAAHAADFQADAVIALGDAWACDPGAYGGLRWVPWFPVDHDPLPVPVFDRVRQSACPIVMSRFGERVARAAGLDPRYVPLAVDADHFRPQDQADARRAAGLPSDRFVVGMVADNKDPHDRKAFCAQMAGFKAFYGRHPDALLYLHTNTGTDGRGIDLPDLCDAFGLNWAAQPEPVGGAAVLFSDPYRKLLGYPEAAMASVFSSLDVLLAASAWEGFGLPLIEAQACGIPVVTSDWTSMAELCFGGWLIAPRDTEFHAGDGLRVGVRYPRAGAVTEALEAAYATPRADVSVQARAGVEAYHADRVAVDYWQPLLEDLALDTSPRTFAEAVAL